jgi:aryl-alcohol dehydrogenase-like predicted oxidoreductase
VRYRLLGRSGLRVSEVALGTMTFGESWGWGASKHESRRIFEAFAEAGGNFIDSACNYTDGESEALLGEFVAPDRDRFVLATKYTLTSRPDDPNAGGNHRKNMIRSLEGSLRRLGTDHVDLLYLHMWDGMTPVEEVLRAMDDLVRVGKVLYVGMSDTPAWVVAQAVTIAEQRGWTRPVAVQAPYSVADRSVERELIPMASANDLAVTAWGTLEGGALTGKYGHPADEPRRYESASDSVNAIADEVVAVAEELSCSPAKAAIAWVRGRPGPIIPILGARTEAQLRDGLGALEVALSDAQTARLNAAAMFDLGFPRSFLETDDVRELIFGNTYDLIDHRSRL